MGLKKCWSGCCLEFLKVFFVKNGTKKAVELFLVVFLLIVFLFLSLYKLSNIEFIGSDELDTVLLSTSINKTNHYMPSYFMNGKLFFVGGPYDLSQTFRPALESWGQYYFARLLSNYREDQSAFLVRIPFVIVGFLSLIIIYITSVKAGVKNRMKAILFLLILSCSGVFITFRFARYYSLVFFFTALFYYAFINFILSPKKKIFKHELFIGVIAIAGLYFSHYLSFFFLIGGCVLFLMFHIKYLAKNRYSLLIFSFFVILLLLHFFQFYLVGAVKFANYQSIHFAGQSRVLSMLGNFSFKFMIFLIPFFLIKWFKVKEDTYLNRYYLLSIFFTVVTLFLLSTMWRSAYWFILFPLMTLICLVTADKINDKKQVLIFIGCVTFSVFVFFIPNISYLQSQMSGNSIAPTSQFDVVFNSLNSSDNMMIEMSMGSYYFLKNYKFKSVGQIERKYKNNFKNLSAEFFDDFDDFRYYIGSSPSLPDDTKIIHGKYFKLLYSDKIDQNSNLFSSVISMYRKMKFKITKNNMLLGNQTDSQYYYIYEKKG